jgi:hypothetical protein
MAANFTEFGAEGSATSWAVTLHHEEMTRSSVVRSRVTHLRSIEELAGRRFNRSRPTIGASDKFWRQKETKSVQPTIALSHLTS